MQVVWPGLQIPLSWADPRRKNEGFPGFSHTGPQPSFKWAVQAVPISLIRRNPNYGPRWREQWGSGLHSGLEGSSVQGPDSLGAERLKKTWKDTLEQQDGHDNKSDTKQEQQPHRNAPS